MIVEPHPHPSLPPEGEGEKCAKKRHEQDPHPVLTLSLRGKGLFFEPLEHVTKDAK